MELDVEGGCLRLVGMILAVLLIIAAVVGVVLLTKELQGNSATERDYARAAVIRAQEGLEETRARNFEQRFILWNTAMAMWLGFDLGGLLLVIMAAVAAFLGGAWFASQKVLE